MANVAKKIGNDVYLTAPEAARRIGVSRWTMKRWLSDADKLNGEIKVRRDPMNNRHYIAKDSVRLLAKRFQKISG